MTFTRRRMLQIGLGTGAALAVGGSTAWLDLGRELSIHAVDRSVDVFGTTARLRVLHADRRRADAAADAAIAELRTVQQVMSVYDPASDVSRLNRYGMIEQAHPYLLAVLEQAAAVSQWSAGAFDVTVQPIWQTYARAMTQRALPSDRAIADAAALADWRQVRTKHRTVRLGWPGMAITLNGIAQGYAADRVAAVLTEHGIKHALVNTGEVLAMGRRDDAKDWHVGVQHPRRADAYLTTVGVTDRCIATSGDYATPFSDDLKHHHIVRPATGRSPDELASVSIAAPHATWADALSTAVFVMGPSEGLQLIQSIDKADAALVFKDGRTLTTAGFPAAKGV